ncbi:MAG: 7-carboxy-7-deazaguanine synthase QueE, partial [Chloroflexi bacterium]|nr:7-carboxy-7-deazaguanine synthase QueE [Chloroflexota bacterium]
MLKVSRKPDGQPEIFYSLQGEGVTMGTPTVFLRLALCNLTCTWCDTKYTWDWEHYDIAEEAMEMSRDAVEESILAFRCPHLVITGGEPLMQQKELAPLVSSLKQKGFYCEVETNGTLAPLPAMARDIDQWNVSPKLDSSGNLLARREIPQVLEAFCALPNAYFKFVIVEPGDVKGVCSLREKY